MKLVQMFFDWLAPRGASPKAPQAAARGPEGNRRAQESRPSPLASLASSTPIAIIEVASHPRKPTRAAVRPRLREGPVGSERSVAPRKKATKQDLYDTMVREMCGRYQVRVRKWRTSMSGIAWYVEYRDGRIQRLIESPKPKSPMSAAIFLHEIGHHHIGLGIHKPRCLEEYMAWMYSLEQMKAWQIDITPRVERRVQRSLRYAVRKAQRRGIRSLPPELLAYCGDQA